MNEDINPPVEIGDVLNLGIDRMGRDGDPIMTYKNFIIFLKDFKKKSVELSKLIEVKITKVFPNFAFAVRVE